MLQLLHTLPRNHLQRGKQAGGFVVDGSNSLTNPGPSLAFAPPGCWILPGLLLHLGTARLHELPRLVVLGLAAGDDMSDGPHVVAVVAVSNGPAEGVVILLLGASDR